MNKYYRMILVMIGLVSISGCSALSRAPKPPECKGEYRPINIVEQKGASFDGTGKIVRCEDRGQHGQHG